MQSAVPVRDPDAACPVAAARGTLLTELSAVMSTRAISVVRAIYERLLDEHPRLAHALLAIDGRPQPALLASALRIALSHARRPERPQALAWPRRTTDARLGWSEQDGRDFVASLAAVLAPFQSALPHDEATRILAAELATMPDLLLLVAVP